MSRPPGSPAATLGRRLGRHTGIYASGAVIAFVLGLVQVAVLTRFLTLDEFGALALYVVFATTLSFAYNLGSLQGSVRWVFRVTDDEGLEDDVADEGSRDPRRALGTAVALTGVIALAGTLLVSAAAPALVTLLGQDDAALLRLAAVSGGLGAVWRLVSNVPRYERRPVAFIVLGAVRPVLVLSVTIPLVAAGHGVSGALLGLALGTAAASAVGVAATHSSYRPAISREDAVEILRGGWPLVPIVISIWVVHNVDLYLVSAFADDAQTALYRVASRLGNGLSYLVSAFLLAWATLTRTSLFTAVQRVRGRPAASAVIIRYYWVLAVGATLALSVFADDLIRIAPDEYADAAPIIPLVGLGFVAYGAFVALYRGSRFPDKRRRYLQLILATGALFLAVGIPLTAWLGSYGAAVSQIVAFGVTSAALAILATRSATPLPLEYDRLAMATLIGVGCIAVNLLLAPAAGDWRLLVDVVAALAFPVLIVAMGVVPVADLRALRAVPRERERPAIEGEWERQALAMLVRRRLSPAEVAQALDTSEADLLSRVVGALRQAAALGEPSEMDGQIGTYLLSDKPRSERDALARRLCSAGADPFELDRLELTLDRLRRSSLRRRVVRASKA